MRSGALQGTRTGVHHFGQRKSCDAWHHLAAHVQTPGQLLCQLLCIPALLSTAVTELAC
jgi:hypothetical protein